MKKKLLFRALALVTCLMSTLSAVAAEAYVEFIKSSHYLIFKYDNNRSSSPYETFSLDLNMSENDVPEWTSSYGVDGVLDNVYYVRFNQSFANARPTSTANWFIGLWKLQSIFDMKYLNTSNVTNMEYMFSGCPELSYIQFDDGSECSLNTSNVTNMSGMFSQCESLRELDLRNWNTSKVTDMRNMFNNCKKLTSLDLSSFNTSRVTDMRYMFENCSELITIYVGVGWSTAAVTSSQDMFRNCTKIRGQQGTTYNSSYTNKTYARVDKGTSYPGYLSSATVPYACITSSNWTMRFYYDNNWGSRSGTVYPLNTGSGYPAWLKPDNESGTTDLNGIRTVAFESSFANARPTSTEYWFYGFNELTSVIGISNLNTSEVTNMNNMFFNCCSLTRLDLSSFNTAKVTDMSEMFSLCTGLESLYLGDFNTSKVIDMSGMFSNCIKLTSLDLSTFNTSKVTNMSYMFTECFDLQTIYVSSGWTTSAVTSSQNMFRACTQIRGDKGTTYDENHINKAYAHIDGGTSNPGYLSAQTNEAYVVFTSSNWTLTFYYDKLRSTRSGKTYSMNTGDNYPEWGRGGIEHVVFDPSFANYRPTTTYCWFSYMEDLLSFSGLNYLNTSKVTNMAYMFEACCEHSITTLDLSHFDTSNVTDMHSMFSDCSALKSLDLSNWNTSKVTDMNYMFAWCYDLESLDLSSFNTSNVTNMYGMFYSCRSLTSLDLSNFSTSKVSDMRYMFNGCSELTTIFVGNGWTTAAVTASVDMFKGSTKIKGQKGTTYDANHIDAAYAHIDGGPSNPGYLSSGMLNEAYAEYTSENTTLTFYYDNLRASRTGTTYDLNDIREDPAWFSDATARNNIKEVVFDPSFAQVRPYSTYGWFFGMQKLETIKGIYNLNTSEVIDMSSMFLLCTKLTGLDLSHFNTSNVTDMSFMFYGCSNLTTIYVGSRWSTAAVTTSIYMFMDCPYLEGDKGTVYDSEYVDATYAHIDGGYSNPGYLSSLRRGDVNIDGVVNVADVTELIYIVLHRATYSLEIADVNYDGTINVADVTALIQLVLNN